MPSSVHFLNVGQAHATVAIDADSALVVDCPVSGVEQAEELLKRSNPAQFDVVVTHQDLDHCGGVHELLLLFGKNDTTLYMNPVGRQYPQERPRVKTVLQRIFSVLDEIGANPAHAFTGENDNTGKIVWSVLAPQYSMVVQAALLADPVNSLSIVLMLQIGGFRFLIPGDIDDTAADELLNSGTRLSADVFLLPHHGARLAKIEQLITAVDPQYIVVSAGRRKTHPHIATLTAAASYGCRLMCTQATFHCHPAPLQSKHCAGSVVFDLNGGSLSVDPSTETHMSRINQLATPVCLKST